MGRQQFSANYHLIFRLFKACLFLGVLATIISLSGICQLSLMDLLVCCLAFLPTGWGLILVIKFLSLSLSLPLKNLLLIFGFVQIAQAVRPKIQDTGLWELTRVLAQAYDYGMGAVLFAPIACLAWMPIIAAFQTRFLFNEAFKRRLQIQPILAGKKKQS